MGIMDGFGDPLLEVFANRTITYEHKKTGEILTDLQAVFKREFEVNDKIGGKTEFQNVPHFRVIGLPWDENNIKDDTITEADGKVWRVIRADKSQMGITNCYVQLPQKPRS